MIENRNIKVIENFLENDYANLKKNLEKLVKDYKRKENRLNTIINQSDKQQQKLLSLNEELDSYKNELEIKVEEEIIKREEKEKMLLQQSKLAAMGEMMDAVAHQWKQPINIIKMNVDMIGYDFDDNIVDKKYLEEFQNNIFNHINHMISTLNEFRTFFRPNQDMEDFDVSNMIQKVLLLVKDEFVKNSINITLESEENFFISGIENEFKHLILNIINNSKDAFIENNTQNREITIRILKIDEINSIEIVDNAGGIPNNVIDDIFKANVTTKTDGKGTGIGLYMSSQIATKHHGILSVSNVENGARFVFSYKK